MSILKRISVFCGSSPGYFPKFREEAFRLGQVLADRKIGLVYGGTNVGLMAAVADGALSRNGEVTGVIPAFIKEKGIAHNNLTKLILVDTMHERKSVMHDLSDGIIALPGGFGTLEEFFEALTWGQLGLHKKAAGILNTDGFYDPLKTLLQTMVDKGFLKEANRKMLLMSSSIESLLDLMESYKAPGIDKWIMEEPEA